MKMDAVAISWLVASASSPLVAVLALWTIYVFHTYRRRWRTVDLFLLAITSQELVSSIFTFCFAILSLIHAPFPAPCIFIQWGMLATRTFQISTLTSMVVDRALTVRWPYRYRFSVRRNQIRYHIAVLALVSVLMGVAAVFARVPDDGCHLHPVQWDIRYVVFLLSLYGLLVLVSFACTVQVEVHRVRHGTKVSGDGSFQLPECASPDLPSATGMNSPLDTQSSTGSTRALHRPSRQASRRPYGKNNKSTSDLRWPSVALSAVLCFFLNHIPYLVLMGLATWHPYLWSKWHESILSWLTLLEGLLLPLLLFCRDPALRCALRRAFQRRSGALSPLVGDDGPFQMYFDKDHFRKRGTFGSVTPIGIITNYRRTPGKRRPRKGSGKYTLPGLHNGDSVLPKSCFLGQGGEPLSKLSCADLTSLEMWREEDEFYATLSDDFSTFSCKSADDSALSEDMRISEELYGGSFTTVANDDFEFHDTRPCGGEVKMKPALVSPATPVPIGSSRSTSFKGFIRSRMEVPKVPEELGQQDVFICADRDEEKDPSLFILPPAGWKSNEGADLTSPDQTPPQTTSNSFGTMSKQKSTSYSMNDLDLLHKRPNIGHEVEATFILPVKSESTMSLYKLNVDQDIDQMAITPSRSENNVNGDSGFGSGAQSTNPVWSGFLCRKPSDPFWNMRKPVVHSASTAVTPTRNYAGVLHPRMRKIPWISAWKKLDENSIHNKRRQQLQEMENQECLGWKENLVYESNAQTNPCIETHVGTIDEELSDVTSPIYSGDYNLNIFAKESGVLMENAYGKIVRNDCGVQVNFYAKNVQYENKEFPCDKKEAAIEESVPLNINDGRQLVEEFAFRDNRHDPLNELLYARDVEYLKEKELPADGGFCGFSGISNDYNCETRVLGGHYENLFGPEENIFSQSEKYNDIKDTETSKTDNRLNSRTGNCGGFGNNTSAVYNEESKHVYGQLNKLDRSEISGKKSGIRSPMKTKELRRRESDNRSNRSRVNRRESRTRSDPRPNCILETNARTTFAKLGMKGEEGAKPNNENNIEIEMKSVNVRGEMSANSRFANSESGGGYYANGNQNRSFRESGNEQRRSKLDSNRNAPAGQQAKDGRQRLERRDSRNRGKEPSRDRKPVVERRQSGRKTSTERKEGIWQADGACKTKTNVERKESGKQVGERKPSGVPVRIDGKNLNKVHHQSDIPKLNKRLGEGDGLWANAIPFPSPHLDKEEENGNSPKRDCRKERQPHRSPRKSNLPRRESDSKGNVKRKTSGKIERTERDDTEARVWEMANRTRPSDADWTHQQADVKGHSNLDDFLKYREKCEDNFSRIQNLNREASRVEQLMLGGKLNGNIPQNGEAYPFETFCETGKVQFLQNSRLSCEDNDNCREKKLAITDFL